jgi:enoyl-CoA hydratase/carnithine racemase
MAKPKYVATPKLEDYKEQFKDHLVMERKNGILQVRMHTNGGPVRWCFQVHQALAEAWSVIGHDPENEVLILTSTDQYWIGEFDNDAFAETEDGMTPDIHYDVLYHDATKLLENFIFDIDIPTISAINGPGTHWECAMLCDITLCVPEYRLRDNHFKAGFVPGDGQFLCLQSLLGHKRASYMMYTLKNFDAEALVQMGAVNEILPKEKLLPRAWEIAGEIMQQPRPLRRFAHQLAVRPWKRILINDLQVHIGHEMYSHVLLGTRHDFAKIKARWTDAEKALGKAGAGKGRTGKKG